MLFSKTCLINWETTACKLCTLHTQHKQCTLHIAHCTHNINSAHCTLHTQHKQCTLHTQHKQCTLHTQHKQCTLHTQHKQCTLHTAHRTQRVLTYCVTSIKLGQLFHWPCLYGASTNHIKWNTQSFNNNRKLFYKC
jgi:hypothetical protein